MSKKPDLRIVDGRRQRSERSRAAIITAALNLIDNGNFAPTAREIAEEAGIGLRSFFRHFDDMEALMETIDQHMREFYESLFVRPFKSGTLEERIEDIIIDRSEAYERLKKLMMTSQAQLWRSKVVQKNYARNQKGLRKHLDKWLPELAKLPAAHREAVHAAASFENWHRLRQHQKLNISDARMAMMVAIKSLLG
ncbi:MAG: HTH-type transcriptional repressor FabR [Alphaproteobacteria bacterium]|nr:MAG: HTH-type transcriptional repressor FabR [Alphaproteobacteria bacterium]